MTLDDDRFEFSRRLDVDEVGAMPLTERIVATDAERGGLARRFGLAGLNRLEGRLTLARRPGGLIRLDGEIEAEVEQVCVVTLEPFAATVGDRFTLFYADLDGGRDPGLDVDMLDDEAWPEAIDRGAIDLGEAVAQQLSLALDPHPRAPGAVLEATSAGDEDAASDNPFRALAEQLSGSKDKE